MPGDEMERSLSQVQPQPLDSGPELKEMKNAIKKKAPRDFQLNPLGGPLNQDFTSQ